MTLYPRLIKNFICNSSMSNLYIPTHHTYTHTHSHIFTFYCIEHNRTPISCTGTPKLWTILLSFISVYFVVYCMLDLSLWKLFNLYIWFLCWYNQLPTYICHHLFTNLTTLFTLILNHSLILFLFSFSCPYFYVTTCDVYIYIIIFEWIQLAIFLWSHRILAHSFQW